MRRIIFWPLVFLFAITWLTAAAWAQSQSSKAEPETAPKPLPLAPGAKVINLTAAPGFFNEPSIAVNPKDPQQLVVAWQINASVAYSRDGGGSWNTAENTAPKDYKVSGDVSVAYGPDGAAYLCYIAFDKLGTTNYWGHNATRNGVFVRRSPDGGKSWEKIAHAVIEHPTTPGIPFEDKPYIVADTTSSPYSGNLYIGWTEFSLEKSVILFSRSSDGGTTWSAPIEISTHEGLPRDDNGSVEGFTGAVAPDGTLYAVWADGNNIAFASSRDGGKSFAPSHSIVDTAPPYFDVAGVERSNGFPQIGLAPASGLLSTPLLYVTWSDYRNGDVDVFSATSANHGESWNPAVRVNSDGLHDGIDQFFQWLAVDPKTGAANVVFYDRRGDPQNSRTTVTLARSTDGGKTFVNYAWTREPFEGNKDFIGDYTGIAAWDGRIFGVWAEEVASASAVASAGDGDRHRAPRTIVRVGIADFNKTATSH
ncbi:MAG TPA: sialidase family protein [Terriglobales bacterium]|nr:sialidase family protein [Terriglobales bacterium]